MRAEPLTVAGGSIAALVTADAALRAGRPVELLLPRRGVAGGFRALEVGDRRLGLGVRLLEIDREDAAPAPSLAAYRPGPSAHAPYVRRVAEWVEEMADGRLSEVDRPAMAIDGRLVDDIYFTVDLDGLRAALPRGEADRTAAEAAAARRATGDAGVLGGGHDLDACSLDAASRANHGPTFHARFIAAMADKIMSDAARRVPAALRRKVWMPLFHPRTLERAAAGLPTGFRPRRPFHTLEPGGMGQIVEELLARVRSAPGLVLTPVGRLVRAARLTGGCTELAFEDGVVRRATRPVLGVGAEELFAAVGGDYRPARVPMAFAWAEVRESDLLALPSLVHAPDAGVPAFRVSPGEAVPGGRRILVVELRHDTVTDEIAAAARASLTATGIVREGAQVEIVHRLAGHGAPEPTRDSMRRFAAAREALDRAALRAEIVGGAAAFGADSFNEQVIQGLRAEETTA